MVALCSALAAVALTLTLAGCGDSGDDEANDPAGTPTSNAAPPECPPEPEEGKPDPIDEPDPDAPDAVPSGATSARLCQGVGTPVDGADTLLTTDVADLVDAINGLKTTPKPEMCTADMGPGYRLVFGYPDGSTFVVSGKTYGCRELVVGSGYRTPAPKALKEFQRLAG